jgi:hypothetical protein
MIIAGKVAATVFDRRLIRRRHLQTTGLNMAAFWCAGEPDTASYFRSSPEIADDDVILRPT